MTFQISSATLGPRLTTKPKCPGRTSVHKGRVVFGAMEEVVFGRPASEAVVEQMDRLGASRAFLMVSGTLNRETDEIEKIRRALGARYPPPFHPIPAPPPPPPLLPPPQP